MRTMEITDSDAAKIRRLLPDFDANTADWNTVAAIWEKLEKQYPSFAFSIYQKLDRGRNGLNCCWWLTKPKIQLAIIADMLPE